MKTYRMILLLAVLMLPVRELFAAEELPAPAKLTFTEFYNRVASYYPKLKKEDADVSLAIARKLQAVSGFLPRVQGLASVTTGDDPVYVFGTLLRQNAFQADDFALSRLNTPRPRANYSFALQGEIQVFDAMQTISKVRSAGLYVEGAKDEKEFVKMEAALISSETYLRAIALDKLIAVVSQVSGDSDVDLKQAEDLKDKGMILGADYYSAKVVFGSVNQIKNRLLRERQALRALMNILMGDDPLNDFEVAGQLGAAEPWSAEPLEEWFRRAEEMRPDLAAAEKAVKAQETEVRRQKFSVLPRISAFGTVEEDTHSLDSNGGQNYVMGFKGTMDLYDPSYPARIQEAEAALRKLECDKAILRDAIKRDLGGEFARYAGALDNGPVSREMFDDGGEAVKLMLPLYREGRKSIADLLEMRFSYLNAAREYYGLLSETEGSRARLLFLSGQLDEEKISELEKRIGE